MNESLKKQDQIRETEKAQEKQTTPSISPTWNEDCLAELDEWIESQGIYLRQ